jgi:hypothetical protein
MKMSRRNLFAAGGSTAMIAMVGSASSSLAQSAASQTTPDTLGAKARQAMIDIFRKDATAVDRYGWSVRENLRCGSSMILRKRATQAA